MSLRRIHPLVEIIIIVVKEFGIQVRKPTVRVRVPKREIKSLSPLLITLNSWLHATTTGEYGTACCFCWLCFLFFFPGPPLWYSELLIGVTEDRTRKREDNAHEGGSRSLDRGSNAGAGSSTLGSLENPHTHK